MAQQFTGVPVSRQPTIRPTLATSRHGNIREHCRQSSVLTCTILAAVALRLRPAAVAFRSGGGLRGVGGVSAARTRCVGGYGVSTMCPGLRGAARQRAAVGDRPHPRGRVRLQAVPVFPSPPASSKGRAVPGPDGVTGPSGSNSTSSSARGMHTASNSRDLASMAADMTASTSALRSSTSALRSSIRATSSCSKSSRFQRNRSGFAKLLAFNHLR